MNVIEIRVEYGRKIDQIQKTNSQKNCNKKKNRWKENVDPSEILSSLTRLSNTHKNTIKNPLE